MSATDDLLPIPPQPEISEGNEEFHKKTYAMYKWMREKLGPAIIEVVNLLRNTVTGAFTSTSTTSFTIGTGDIPITIGTGRSFVPGTSVRAAYRLDPTKYVDGITKSYDGTTGAFVFNGQVTNGDGETYDDWSISIIASSGSFASLVANKFTGLQTLANEVTIASATTIDLTAAGSNQFKLTGTVSVTGATMPQGAVIKGRASAATPLVNSSTFKVQGGKNYTCNPGDWLEFTKDGDGIVYVAITKVNGKPVSFPGNESLVITNNASAPNNKLDIVADGISYSVDITVSGLGGLDTGSEASGTWYYIWLVYAASTSTISAVLSTSSTSPTVSGGYSYGVVIGAIYNDGSSNFIKYYQVDKEFWIGEVAITTTIPPTTYTSVSLAAAVPPNAKSARISAQWAYTSSVSAVNYYAPTSADDLAQKDNITTGSGTALTVTHEHKIPLVSSQTIYYKRTGTAAQAGTLYCSGGAY